MLVHKTRPHNGISSGVFLFLLIILAVASVILALVRLLPSSTQITGSSDAYMTYHNEQSHYSLNYPSGWKVIAPVPDSPVTTFASSVAQPESAGGRYNARSISYTPTPVSANNFSKIDVIYYELDGPMDVTDFMLSKTSSPIDGKISNIKVGGMDALLVEVHTAEALAQREENLIYKSVFVTKGNYGFIVAGFASIDTFDSILQSFQIDD